MKQISKITELFERRGDSEYGGEAVTQREHALQCALLAEQAAASAALIAAALLHDVGHLLHDLPEDAPDQGIDDTHEELGYRYLQRWFGDAVAEPVRLHVAAKRYLCAQDASYLAALSTPSLQSLRLQGGPMSVAEASEFESNAFCDDAVRLRHWDDQAKVEHLVTPELVHFVPYLEECLRE